VANLALSGALIPVRLGVPERQPIQTLGMIDTGAGFTLIHTGLVNSLGLTPIGTTWLITVTQEAFECPEYRIRLQFPQGVYIDVTSAASTWQREDYWCIIGWNALKHGVLTYNGVTKSFTLVF